MKKFIELFLMLFIGKKANEVKKEAFIERQNAVVEYAKVKEANNKFLAKYSGKKRYVKTGKIY